MLSNALARQLAPGGYHVTTSDELERENRHFVMSDAIIEAMEQAKQVIPYFDPSASYGSGLTLCNGGGGSTGSRTPSRTNSMVSSALRTVSTAASALNTISSPGWHRALDSEPATPLASVCTTDDGTSDDAAGRETVRPDSRSADSPLRREVCSLRAVSEGRAVVDSASEDCGSSETTGVGGGNGGKAMVEGTEQLTLLQKSPGSPLPRLVPARSLRFREDEGDDNSEDPDGGTEVDDASEYTDVMMEPQRAGSDYSGAGGGAGGAGSDSAGAFALGLPPPPLSDDVGWHLSSSPASVALGFLRSMGGDEALAASAQLLVGETEDVPQALLPLPVLNLRDVGSHHSDDPQALAFPQIVRRGRDAGEGEGGVADG